MCGRYVSRTSTAELAEQLGVDDIRVDEQLRVASYNVTPRSWVPAVRQRDDARVLSLLRWGLVPSWAKSVSVGDRAINARAESLADRPMYRSAFERHRCLIPADGFYEWAPPAKPGGRKQPVYVQRRDGRVLAFAGLWAARPVEPGDVDGVEDGWLRTCTIVTTQPNELLAPIHDRMPVVLDEDDWAAWLDPANRDLGELEALLLPAPSERFESWAVGRQVNKPENDGPELIERVTVA